MIQGISFWGSKQAFPVTPVIGYKLLGSAPLCSDILDSQTLWLLPAGSGNPFGGERLFKEGGLEFADNGYYYFSNGGGTSFLRKLSTNGVLTSPQPVINGIGQASPYIIYHPSVAGTPTSALFNSPIQNLGNILEQNMSMYLSSSGTYTYTLQAGALPSTPVPYPIDYEVRYGMGGAGGTLITSGTLINSNTISASYSFDVSICHVITCTFKKTDTLEFKVNTRFDIN